MRRVLAVALPLAILFLSAIPTLAQERSAEMLALDYWVGEWTTTSAEGPGTTVCKWLGTSFVQCEADGAAGPGLWVMGYDATEAAYSFTFFGGNGESAASDTMTQQDGTMTALMDIPTGGQFRGTWVLESQDVMTYKGEMAVEGGDWVVQYEVRSTRVR